MNTSLSAFDDDSLGRRLRALGAHAGTNGHTTSIDGPSVIDGSVVLDSLSGGLDAMRSAGVLEQRQIVVTAADATVVFDLDPCDDGWRVSGQLIGFELPAAVQFLDPLGEELTLVVTDDLGEFQTVVPDGDIQVVVATARTEVVIDLPMPR